MSRTAAQIDRLESEIERLGFWYHNLDLGDGVWTNPEHPHGDYPRHRWDHISSYVPDDCTGLTVLDIGCNAGFFSLEMRRRGASYVLGIDESPISIAQARFAAAELGYPDIDYRCASVYDVDKLIDVPGQIDIVLFLGVFYHLRHPLLMLDKLSLIEPRRMFFQTMLRGTGGHLDIEPDYPIEEVGIFDNPRYPAMYFVEHRFANDPTNWWLANDNGVKAMLRSSGFTDFVQTENGEVIVCDAPTHRPDETHWSARRKAVARRLSSKPLEP